MYTSGRKILIIEDDAGITELLKDKLASEGYSIETATTGKSAIESITSQKPYLIILDYSLPDMKAGELVEKLTASGMEMPPFIVSTGQGDEQIAVTMMKLGAKDYIIKDSHFLDMIQFVVSKTDRLIESERKFEEIENQLEESTFLSKQIIRNAHEGIIVYDAEMKYVVWNPYMEKISGFVSDEVCGKNALTVFPFLENTGVIDSFHRALKGENSPPVDIEFNFPRTGKSGWVTDTSSPLYDAQGKITGVITVVSDITDRKNNENRISSLLKEKELILREVHHRIKNNMNTMQSLLALQAGRLKDPAASGALKDAASRVKSMLLLYDKIYKSSDFTEVSVRSYFDNFIESIINTFPNCKTVKIEKNIDDFKLHAKILFPFGIIINELITNIMKYAFIDRPNGLVSVNLKKNGNEAVLVITDNGNGLPEDIDFENSTGFGLMLVGMLSDQINGKIEIKRENGTKIILEFKI